MSFTLGSATTDAFYVGGNVVDRIYLGTSEVWSAQVTFDAAVLSYSPHAYYKLDDTDAVCADASGNGRNGTHFGGVRVTGLYSGSPYARFYDGIDDYSTVDAGRIHSVSVPYAVFFVVEGDASTYKGLYTEGTAGNTSAHFIIGHDDVDRTKARALIKPGFGSVKLVTNGAVFADGTPHMALFIDNIGGTPGSWAWYIDGSLDSSGTHTQTTQNYPAFDRATIGAERKDGSPYAFRVGTVDSVVTFRPPTSLDHAQMAADLWATREVM